MPTPLSSEDPTGNLPLMAYRIFRRITQNHLTPDEWAILEPHVEQAVRQWFGTDRAEHGEQ